MSATRVCPKCRAFLEPGARRCPYCDADVRHVGAPSPMADALATSRLGLYLIGLNAVLYFLMVWLDPWRGDTGQQPFDPSALAVNFWGVSDAWSIRHCGQYWRLVTAIFLHLDLMHLVFNCVAIYILLPLAAHSLAASRTTTIYLAGGILASVGSHLAGNSGAGASGAVCALITAVAVWGRRSSGHWDNPLSSRMFFWALITLGYGFLRPGIDNVAHGVGLAAGLGIGWFAASPRARGGRADRLWTLSARSLLAAVALAFALFLVPSVVRSFERRDMELYASEVGRIVEALDSRARGVADVALPASVPDGPSGTDEVRDALRDAVAASGRSARGAETRQATKRALDAVRAWQDRLSCLYFLDFRGN